MKFDCVDRLVSRGFGQLGLYIGRRPGYFIIIPLLVAIILATGLQRTVYEGNPEYLFSPVDGRSRTERKLVETFFPMNTSENFDLGRMTRMGRLARILIDAKDGGSVLTTHVFNELLKLDAIIKNITIIWDGDLYTYKDLCAKTNGICFHNDILDFEAKIQDIENRKYLLQYPLMFNHATQKQYHMLSYLGGVTVDKLGFIEKAAAYNMFYPLDTDIKHGDERAKIWETKFLSAMEDLYLENITIGYFVSESLESELEKNTQSVTPFFSITLIVMLGFSVVTSMMLDWVKSKPWLGILGCFSSCIAVIAAFGLVIYCGLIFIGINLAAPFLMLGIGMDDTFVLLAAWRRTDPRKSVEERMAETYSDVAVSITITSLTNFISFLVGVITPFPSVQIFCIYTAMAVLFTYIWHITFFGGCMAVSGYAESRNLHGVFCIPTTAKSVAISQKKSALFRLLCTGGLNEDNPDNPIDNQEHALMIFFRDKLGRALSILTVKIVVIMLFFLYLAVGIWGCTLVKEGLERHKLSRYDSYSVTFYKMDDMYFRKYPYRIHVVVSDEMNYADPEVHEAIENMLQKLESSKFIAGSSLTESWLRAYLQFQKDDRSFAWLDSFNLTKKEDFIGALHEVFFRMPLLEHFKRDIVFNENKTSIVTSRFMIQTQDINDANEEKDMVLELREIVDSFPFNVTVYQQYFIFWDQFILVRETSIQAISVAAAVMMVISLIFIPKPMCALWVAFSIVSIEIGVVGYMTHWNVNLDSISMINLIMCIGFSVDYSAHISYAYISSDRNSPNERMRSALHSLGMPILQGSFSTILGIVSLAFAPSYIFLTFFKTVFLVILFAALHGILLLPVLLSLSDCCSSEGKDNISELPPIPNTLYHSEKPQTSAVTDKAVIVIPRPSYANIVPSEITHLKSVLSIGKVEAAEVDSGKGTRDTSSFDSNADKDLGIGTSGEESSEGSCKGAPVNLYSTTNRISQLVGYPYLRSAEKGKYVNQGFESGETGEAERFPPAPPSRNSSRMSLYHADSRTGLFGFQNGRERSCKDPRVPARSPKDWLSSMSRTKDKIPDSPLSFHISRSTSGYELPL
ncbi:patched domain-containing protein 3-like [Tachypleus tridentatus]|uniref:patched domain-containing protein 3-like n=1 Tax=Tachypleus tridentatus TaxID=6853 RepID=UPI003FCF2503